jgi:Cu/Ag efflux protein CusF
MNWRAKPLVSLHTIVSFIASKTTKTGLKVKAASDDNIYQTAIKVTDEEMEKINLIREEFHGEGNYIIKPS